MIHVVMCPFAHGVKGDVFVFPKKKAFVSMELERKSQSITVKSFILTDFQHMSNKEINSLLSLNPGPPLRAHVRARLSNSLAFR